MKRLLILASAAIVALASCSKTQVVYNDAPEEIGFKTVTGVMTKAATLDEHTTMGVFAHNTTDKTSYFENISFAPANESDVWKGNPAQYWPLADANLDFVFYAPRAESGITRTYNANANTLAIEVDNSTDQTNWLYGSAMKTGNKSSNTADVSPTMKHLLAKIEINLTGTISLNQMTLTGTEQKETATITYANDASTVSWSNTGTTVDMALVTSAVQLSNDPKDYSCYVIPSAQTSIKLNYILPGGTQTSDHTITLSNNWVAGYKYIYNINVEPGEITFSPSVETWTESSSNILVNQGEVK